MSREKFKLTVEFPAPLCTPGSSVYNQFFLERVIQFANFVGVGGGMIQMCMVRTEANPLSGVVEKLLLSADVYGDEIEVLKNYEYLKSRMWHLACGELTEAEVFSALPDACMPILNTSGGTGG